MSSDRIELRETITDVHDDILVCPTCFNKWKLSKRKVDIDIEITGDKPVEISPEIKYNTKLMINRSLVGDVFCPDCDGPGSELITMDSGIYEAVKLFNRKGYNTVYSCAGGEDSTPYIALKLNDDQLNEWMGLVPIESMNEHITMQDMVTFQNFQIDPHTDIPDGLEFIRDLQFRYISKLLSQANIIYAKNWNIGIYSKNKSNIVACEEFYKLASVLKDLSTKEDTK